MTDLPPDDPFRPLDEAEATGAEPRPDWCPIVPVPDDVPGCFPPHRLGKPTAYWVYRDNTGQRLYVICRFDLPDGSKEFLPLTYCEHPDGRREWRWKGLPKPRPLYGLNLLAERTTAPVIVCEGEKSADAAGKRFPDHVTTTSPNGAKSAGKADWSPLAGRRVVIWPDHDDEGRAYAADVARLAIAAGAESVVVVTVPDAFPEKWDLADTLPEGWTEGGLRTLLMEAAPVQTPPTPSNPAGTDDDSGSQASQLITFITSRADLFHDENKDVYARDRQSNEVRRIDSRSFKDWCLSAFFGDKGKAIRDQSFREALSTISGLGRFGGECLSAHIRCAEKGGTYFLDLAEPGNSRAIAIGPGAWSLVDNPPVMFTRPDAMRPLPVPVRGGDLSGLWALVNVPQCCRLLVLAWLIDSLRPETPFPLLEIVGEQGSAKSTTQALLRRLIDPNACDLRGAPKTVEDIFVGAGANWLVSYENISHLSPAMQDALCILSTGGGYAKRKLYSDADESVIQVKRPVAINGIACAVTAQDLIDRAVTVEAPTIIDRAESGDIHARFNLEWPRLLGALLDLMAGALARLPSIHLAPKDRPRLAEFARLGMAVAEELGQTGDAFLAQFKAGRNEAILRTIDASPVAAAVIAYLEANPHGITDSASEIMKRMEAFKPARAENWPWSPKGFADAMRRAAPALRQIGVVCRSLPKTGGNIRWEVRRDIGGNLPNPSPECPASPDDGRAVIDGQDVRTFRTSPQNLSPDGWEATL